MAGIEAFWKEKQWKRFFQKENLIVLLLSGVLLFIIAIPVTEKEEASSGEPASFSFTAQETKVSATEERHIAGSPAYSEYAEYEAALEMRLRELLEQVKGVGRVQVMVTLASSDEQVVEKDQPVRRTNTTENDAAGGNRIIYDVDAGETTVYQSAGSESTPYVVKTLMPRIEGVAVVAQGAGTGEISKNITELLQALFDLEAHKIKVIPGK